MGYRPQVSSGQPGAIEGINALYTGHNSLWTPDDYPNIINVQSPDPRITGTGAVGDGVTDDTDALQAIFDWLEGSRARNHFVWFPFYEADGTTAFYQISAPLRIWSHTQIRGPATIRTSSSFDWVNHPYSAHANYRPVGNAQPGNIAALELWRDSGFRYSTSRIHIDSLSIECSGQVGSIGAMFKMQQDGATRKLRIDNAETGFVTWGQDGYHERMQIGGQTGSKVGVYLGSDFAGDGEFGTNDCKYMSFNKLNVESWSEAAIRMECDGPNWFQDSHFENQQIAGPATTRLIDCRSGQFTMDNTNAQHSPPDASVIVVGDMTPVPGIVWCNYVIRNWRNNNTSATQMFMDDRIRNKQIYVGINRMIEYLSGGFQNDGHGDYDAFATWLGDEGGEVRIGGVKGGDAAPAGHSGAQFTVIPNINQDEPSVRFTDSANVLRSGVGQKGNLFFGSFNNTTRSAITSGMLAGTAIWNTDDNAPNFWDGAAWRDAMGATT